MSAIDQKTVDILSCDPTTITKLNDDEIDILWDNYCQNIRGTYYFDVEKYTEFLNQYSHLENLKIWPSTSSSDDYNKLSHLSLLLPNLRSLSIRGMNFNNFHWIAKCQNLQELDCLFYVDENPIDLAPLEQLNNLTKVHIKSLYDITNVSKIPLSVKDLVLKSWHGKIENVTFENYKFISLKLNSSFIKSLPPQEAIDKLEFLDISDCAICDLSPIANNLHLKVFKYNFPDMNASYSIDFAPLKTLANLEELSICNFAQTEKELKSIFEGLTNLKKFSLTSAFDGCIKDLSFLEGRSFTHLTIAEDLIDLVPASVLLNPNLKELCIIDHSGSIEHDLWTHLPLDLDKLILDGIQCVDLNKLTNFKIKALDFWETDKVVNGDKMIEIAPSLEFLSMHGKVFDQLVDTYQEALLESFKNLQVLDLDYDLEPIHSLEFLKKLPSLKIVDIDAEWDNIKPNYLDIFKEMKNLIKIKFWGVDDSDLLQKIKELQQEGIPIQY